VLRVITSIFVCVCVCDVVCSLSLSFASYLTSIHTKHETGGNGRLLVVKLQLDGGLEFISCVHKTRMKYNLKVREKES
jgi:hypothetical protein